MQALRAGLTPLRERLSFPPAVPAPGGPNHIAPLPICRRCQDRGVDPHAVRRPFLGFPCPQLLPHLPCPPSRRCIHMCCSVFKLLHLLGSAGKNEGGNPMQPEIQATLLLTHPQSDDELCDRFEP